MTTLRVNVYGAPGSGKSTFAAWLYTELKGKGYHCDLVREHVKRWAYEGRRPASWDQLTLLSEQIRLERELLPHVDLLITDCPVPLTAAYGEVYDSPCYQQMQVIAQQYDYQHASLDFQLLPAKAGSYDPRGRFQNEADARKLHVVLGAILRRMGVNPLLIQQGHPAAVTMVANALEWVKIKRKEEQA